MKALLNTSCLFLILTGIILTGSLNSAHANPRRNKLFGQVKRGKPFLGGKAPKILSLKSVGGEKYNQTTKKYYYNYQAKIKRSGADRNGQAVLYKAKNYGQAIAKIFKVDKKNKKLFDLFFPVSIDKTPFPDVKMNYSYKFFVTKKFPGTKKSPVSLGQSKGGAKEAKTKQTFTEFLSMGLEPGKYIIQMDSHVSMAYHPLVRVYNIYDWATLLFKLGNPVNFAVGKMADAYSGWFTKSGLAKKVFKKVLKEAGLALTTSRVKYQLNVLAKVPYLKGKSFSQAANALTARGLQLKIKYVSKCPSSYWYKVYRQSPDSGKKVQAGDKVTGKFCRPSSSNVNATPTPRPTSSSGSYSVFSVHAGTNLYVGQESVLKNRSPASFANGGLNSSSRVTYSRLAGPYSSLSSAQKALCSGISGRSYASTNCSRMLLWKGTRHTACDSSVGTAVGKYCSQYRER